MAHRAAEPAVRPDRTTLPNREALADDYAALVGLKGFENNYPHELSGGMLKRAEIARALVVKPEILYMDEPFSALDALMSLRMQNELLRILAKERHTVMLITHDVEEAIHLADRILVLSPRPARIQATFDVPFAHPRKRVEPRGAGAARGDPQGAGRHRDGVSRALRLTTEPWMARVARRTRLPVLDETSACPVPAGSPRANNLINDSVIARVVVIA